MKPSDFLPSFFKHAKRAVIPGQEKVDDSDQESKFSLTNLLAPAAQDPIVGAEIAATLPGAPKVEVPVTKAPVIPTTSKSVDPNILFAGDGAALPPFTGEPISGTEISNRVARDMGHVYTNKRGRPQPLASELDPNSPEKTLAVNQAYQNYDPAAVPAKGWRKWVPTMISNALTGFAAGGLGGAMFGAAHGGIRGALDPTFANREWQKQKLGEMAPVVAGVEKQKADQIKTARELAGLEGTLASTALAKKRAADLDKPKPGQIHQDDKGGWISIDPVTKTTAPILDPVTGKQALAKPTGVKEEWIHDEQGVAHKYRDGKDTGIVDPGRKLINVEGYGLMSPASARSADAVEGREIAASTEKATIAGAKAQVAQRESERLRSVALTHLSNADTLEGELNKLDPEDDAQKQAADELRTEIQRLKSEALKLNTEANKLITDSELSKAEAAGASGRAKSPRGRSVGKLAPATHSFSLGEYMKRNKGATPEQARAFAAKNYPGYEIVD